MLSYEQKKLVSKIAWIGIKSGNNVNAEVFEPTPEEYKLLCAIVANIDGDIKRMQDLYGLD